jgi:hypothetical protein
MFGQVGQRGFAVRLQEEEDLLTPSHALDSTHLSTAALINELTDH